MKTTKETTKLPLKLKVELNGIEPSPELSDAVQSYAESLCADLSIPFSPVTVEVIPSGRPSLPSPFQITLNGRPLRTRFRPSPRLPEKPDIYRSNLSNFFRDPFANQFFDLCR